MTTDKQAVMDTLEAFTKALEQAQDALELAELALDDFPMTQQKVIEVHKEVCRVLGYPEF